MNKKGFTLLELLAIIIILAIVVTLLVLAIGPILSEQRERGFRESMNGLMHSADTYLTNVAYSIPNEDITRLPGSNREYVDVTADIIQFNRSERIKSGYIYVENNIIYVMNVTDGAFCANGSLGTLNITRGECP